MAGADNGMPECPPHLKRRGTLSPCFVHEILDPMLHQANEPNKLYNWEKLACKLMPHLHQLDLKSIKSTAESTFTSPVALMIKQYEEYKEVVDGKDLWQAFQDMGRKDIAREMEKFENVFVDRDQPSNYARLSGRTVSQHDPDETSGSIASGSTACPSLSKPTHQRASDASQIEIKQLRGATATPQMEYEQLRGTTFPTRMDPQEDSYYSEQSTETDSEPVFHGNHFLPMPLREAVRISRRRSKKKPRYENSTAHTASTMSSDDSAMTESVVANENSSRFETFDGVVRGIRQPGAGSLENDVGSTTGPLFVFRDYVENNTLVGISFTEQDKALAERLAYHLEAYGCRTVLISRELATRAQVLNQMDAIVVIYSYHYKEQNKPAIFRKSCIRLVFDFLKKEHSRKRGNQRCIFYPTFQVTGQRIPVMFHDYIPRKRRAWQVFSALFQQAGRICEHSV